MLWKPRYLILLSLLLSLFLLSFNCWAEIGIDEFISDGAAKILGSSSLEAKYEALERAKQNAFMQAVCTIISTKQFVDNYSAFKEMISDGTGKYIR